MKKFIILLCSAVVLVCMFSFAVGAEQRSYEENIQPLFEAENLYLRSIDNGKTMGVDFEPYLRAIPLDDGSNPFDLIEGNQTLVEFVSVDHSLRLYTSSNKTGTTRYIYYSFDGDTGVMLSNYIVSTGSLSWNDTNLSSLEQIDLSGFLIEWNTSITTNWNTFLGVTTKYVPPASYGISFVFEGCHVYHTLPTSFTVGDEIDLLIYPDLQSFSVVPMIEYGGISFSYGGDSFIADVEYIPGNRGLTAYAEEYDGRVLCRVKITILSPPLDDAGAYVFRYDAVRDVVYDDGYDVGYSDGLRENSDEVYDKAYNDGYDVGFALGLNSAESNDFMMNIFGFLIPRQGDEVTTVVEALNSPLFGFHIPYYNAVQGTYTTYFFGISIMGLVGSFVSVILLIWFLKLFAGG